MGQQRKRAPPQTRVSWLKPDQVEAMRDAAHEESRYAQRDDAIITLLYDTGLRRSEASQLNRDMLDLDEGLLRLPSHVQKQYPTGEVPPPATFQLDRSGSLRTVRALRAYLNRRDDDNPALFASQKSNRLIGTSINDYVVKRLAQVADVRPFTYGGRGSPEDVSAHTLRHSVAWRMLRAEDGNTLYDVPNRLRHATIITTEREYDHFNTI